jgi:hypothetical protein
MLKKDSFETPLRQVLMYIWKAACNRLNRRKEKKEERIKREVRRMGRNAKAAFPRSCKSIVQLGRTAGASKKSA